MRFRVTFVLMDRSQLAKSPAISTVLPPTEGLSARIDAVVPIYDDFKVAFEQVDERGAHAEDSDAIAAASQPVRAREACC